MINRLCKKLLKITSPALQFAMLLTMILFAQNLAAQSNNEKLDMIANYLQQRGIPTKTYHFKSESYVEIQAAEIPESCKLPFCKVFRRINRLLTNLNAERLSLQIKNLSIRVGGSVDERRSKIVMGLHEFSNETINDFLNFKDLTLRHELNHVLLNQNMRNHFLNGFFDFGMQDVKAGVYQHKLSVQEFYTMTDEQIRHRRSSFENAANPKSFVDVETVISAASFINMWIETSANNQIEIISRTNLTSFEEADMIRSILNEKSTFPYKALTVKNTDPRLTEKYRIYIYNQDVGVTYSFYSDVPYESLNHQIPNMLATIKAAMKIWFTALFKDDLPSVKEFKLLKQLYKSNDLAKRYQPLFCRQVF